jgi:hypothetical protein
MSQELLLAKFENIKHEWVNAMRQVKLGQHLEQLSNSLKSMVGRNTHMAQDAVVLKWREAYLNQRCPYILSRGKNRGQPCGKFDMFSSFGTSSFNPCCMTHAKHWEHMSDYAVYNAELKAAQEADRKVDTDSAEEEMKVKQQSKANILEKLSSIRGKLETLIAADTEKCLPELAPQMLEKLKELA